MIIFASSYKYGKDENEQIQGIHGLLSGIDTDGM